MKKILLFMTCLTLGACVSEQEHRAALYRYEEIIRSQCEGTLGLKTGTSGYMNCHIFYDEYLNVNAYFMSFSMVRFFQEKIDTLNNQCYRYWGQEGISGQNLWSCVQTVGEKQIEQAKRKKELEEQEDILARSIAAGQKDAYDDARLQAKIDVERERVARETGKNPKKIDCKTHTKSNGYVQVKCK